MTNKIKYLLIMLSLLSLSSQEAICASRASQTLNATLPQILSIDKVIVETNEYHRDEPLPSVRVNDTQPISLDDTLLMLTPIKVKIHTNASSPITVTAQFQELNHKEGKYTFNPALLSVRPSSYTINNPYDGIITDYFTPVVDVKPDAVMGVYRGSILFTLGAI